MALLQTLIACDAEEELLKAEFVEALAMSIKGELSRLQEHPDLFPSREVEEEFWQNIYSLCDFTVKDIITNQLTRLRLMKKVQAEAAEDEINAVAPKRDAQREPWEQYLHNRAPGVEVDLSAQGERGSIQIFPMPGVRVVMGMAEEKRAIISDIESVSTCWPWLVECCHLYENLFRCH